MINEPNISDNITFDEATHSEKAKANGVNNIPSALELQYMKDLANNVFEPLRAALGGKPININSFFRNAAVNKLVGGSSTSQHVKGQAMDLDGIHCTNKQIFDYIKNNLEFDQLIWEFGTDKEPSWVHVSFVLGKNRKQILKATKIDGKTKYLTIK